MIGRARRLYRTAVPHGGFKHDVAVLLSGSVLGQGLVIAGTLVLSRLYTPGDLGLLAVFSSLESILVVVTCLRYEQAVAVATDDDDAANLLGVAGLFAIGVTAVVVVVGELFGGTISNALGVPQLRNYVALFGVALAADALYQAFSFWSLRQRHLSVLSRTKVAQGVAQAGGQVGWGALGFRPGGLLWGWTAGRMAGTLRLGRMAQKDGVFARLQVPRMRQVARAHFRFPLFAAPASLLNSASLQLPSILLAAVYGASVAGWFLLATRVVAVPVMIIGQAVSQGFVSRVSEAQRLGRPTGRLVRRTVLVLGGVAAVPGLILVAFGPAAFAVAFGDSWRQAGTYVQLLVPAFVVQFAISPVAWILIARGRQGAQLVWDATRLVLVVAALLVPAAMGAAPAVALAAYSAVLVVTYLVLFAMMTRSDGRPQENPGDESAGELDTDLAVVT